MLFEKMTVVLDPEPHGAALNMALDEVLLRAATGPLLRIYRWARPAVSLGYFEKFAAIESLAITREAVRRWTGGGVVLHGDDVTYTIIVPATEPFARRPAAETYRLIHGCLAVALRRAGVETTLAACAPAKVSTACFENPAADDLLAGNCKIAGAAQRRTRWGLLHQGSVHSVADALLVPQIASCFGRETVARSLPAAEFAAGIALAREKYDTAAWLHRF